MVRLVTEQNRISQPPSDEPCKPLDETWSGERLLPTSRCVALDVDDEPGADIKVMVCLYVVAGVVRGRVREVKPIDAGGDVVRFLPEHRREAIERALELV